MDHTRGHENLTWHTALSCESGACVQVAAADRDAILIGSTRQPGGPLLEYTAAEWNAFVNGVKAGDFDNLLNGLS